MNYTLIQKKLDEILDESTELPLHIENSSVELNSTDSASTFKSEYVRSQLEPTKTVSKSLGPEGLSELTGLYMISVFVPSNAQHGVARANTIGDKILRHFKETKYDLDDNTQLRVDDRNREIGRQFTNYYMLQLSVEWTYFYQRDI